MPFDQLKLNQIFDAAVELTEAERASFLERECAGDPELRAEVESLIAADQGSSQFLEQPIVSLPPEIFSDAGADLVGQQFGAYRILCELGRGGLGTVYLAARADEEFRKEVAIKLIRRGLDTDDILRRFRNERQILAQLDHPNIARLLDGGTTDDGLPYFVMEYVQGEPIDQYCATHGLTSRARLELFRKVCAAVTYAHQNLVVHRDLKPSNILVTAEGEPKLLDFGIAKVLSTDDGGGFSMTLPEQRVLTRDYASPEQIRGERITTASDIYSLGVLLYELLAGEKPYRLKTGTSEELTRAIAKQEPARPKTLSSDLANIVSMAMRKEPARRYASVEQMAEDLRRYLEQRPVLARKDTLRYRASKFVRRNKAGVLVSLLIFTLLIGSTVATFVQSQRVAVQRNRAQREANKAEQINLFLQNILAFSSPSWAGSNPNLEGEATIAQAMKQADHQVASELADQPEVQAAVQFTLGWNYKAQGKLDAAERLLRASYETRRRVLGAEDQDTAQSMIGLGEVFLARGQPKEAEAWSLAALSIYRQAQKRGHVQSKWLATALNNLAVARLDQTGDSAGAEALVREALQVSAGLSGLDRGPIPSFYANLGLLRRGQGDLEGAISYTRLAIEEQRGRPGSLALCNMLSNLGSLIGRKGDYAQERVYLEQALDMGTKSLSPSHPMLAEVLSKLSRNSFDQGEYEKARQEAQHALEIQQHSLPANHLNFMQSWYSLGWALTRLGDLAEGEDYLRRAVDLGKRKAPPGHILTLAAQAVLGENLIAQKRSAEAEPLLSETYQSLKPIKGAEKTLTLTARLLEEARSALKQ